MKDGRTVAVEQGITRDLDRLAAAGVLSYEMRRRPWKDTIRRSWVITFANGRRVRWEANAVRAFLDGYDLREGMIS